jgi:hypothetical protein
VIVSNPAAPFGFSVRDLGMKHHHGVAGNEPAREASLECERKLGALLETRIADRVAHFRVVFECHPRDGFGVVAPQRVEARQHIVPAVGIRCQQPVELGAVLESRVHTLAVERDDGMGGVADQ